MSIIENIKTKRKEKKTEKEYWGKQQKTIREEEESKAKLKANSERLEVLQEKERSKAERKYGVKGAKTKSRVKTKAQKTVTKAKDGAVKYYKTQHELNQTGGAKVKKTTQKKKRAPSTLKKISSKRRSSPKKSRPAPSTRKKTASKRRASPKKSRPAIKAPVIKPPKFNF